MCEAVLLIVHTLSQACPAWLVVGAPNPSVVTQLLLCQSEALLVYLPLRQQAQEKPLHNGHRGLPTATVHLLRGIRRIIALPGIVAFVGHVHVVVHVVGNVLLTSHRVRDSGEMTGF
jgi:hypothetical protein